MDRTPWSRVVALVLGVTTLLAVVLLAFAWPPSEIEPRDLPIAVAGPDQAVAGLEQSAGEDAFAITRVETRAEAVELIDDREAYGAVVAGEGGLELLTASAASPTVANLLREGVTSMAAGDPAAQPPTVTEVKPLPDGDPRGVVFNAGSLPLVLGGIITAVLVSTQLRGRRPTLAGLGGVALAAGLALAGILQGLFDALGGSYLANAGVIALGIVAMAGTIAGLKAWLGMPGIGLGALLMMLVGNPLSGITSAPELLPLGEVGQWLPPGALGAALRSTAYFDGAGAAGPLGVLLAWAVIGVALVLTGPTVRRAESDRAGQPELEPAA